MSDPSTLKAPLDFQQHLADLDKQGLLVRIDRPINKDTELQPLVRWQFVGGVAEAQRRAFLFTNVVDGKGRRYDMPVAIGVYASSPQIYAQGMGQKVENIGSAWVNAIRNPIAPVALVVELGVCASNGDARRLVEQGGLSINGEKHSDAKALVNVTSGDQLKAGKKHYFVLRTA